MKRLIIVFLIICTLALTACNISTSSGSNNGNVVHMNDTNFVQSSISIKKGTSLTIINDSSVAHILQNGIWDNGTPKPSKESGAPTVNVNFGGNDTQKIGPFTTAGTFHILCIIHPDMNLQITVQ
ncbi:MAG TPA: hypothetical protein VFN23_12090 [Ktedonobacteraceae bacterium]|nr:hypothetical protein [Ktedonobacteraceae bacterium]